MRFRDNYFKVGGELPTPRCPPITNIMNLVSDDSTIHLRQSVYWLLICLSAGMMLGRIMAMDAVDRTALAKDRLSRIAAELDRRKVQLRQQGLGDEALEKELARIEAQLRRDAQLRRPFLSANDRSRWCTVRALVEPDMRVEGALRMPSTR